jgi:hypothetical protein
MVGCIRDLAKAAIDLYGAAVCPHFDVDVYSSTVAPTLTLMCAAAQLPPL